MIDRLAAARDYVAKKPTDRFGLYALAMELRKLSAWAECFSTFDTLLGHHPQNGPAWYHYGMAKKEAGDRVGARAVWVQGLALVGATDGKSAREIEEALHGLDEEE